MKCQGIDGLSRGCLNEGIGAGQAILSFCPWHLGALSRNSHLKDWISSWSGENTEFLTPEKWFERGHDLSGGKRIKEVITGLW